ncbi:gem-associated protein 6-like [Tetranychus urticae]|uniref:gem-associated protein 6-like n=1 Tax=Tetranychus urticae TaxID=32264 RepID=UPI00077C05BF|nr:gem-associated protein 6-like [Tetranychus urticae]
MEVIKGDKLRESENNLKLCGKLVGKRVVITTDVGFKCAGLVKAIDPLSGTIVLLHCDEADPSKVTDIRIITGHSIEEVNIEADQNSNQLVADILKEKEFDENELQDRKEKLIDWFKKNRIPIVEKENKDLVVASVITIKPPYRKDDCSSSNVMVIRRIQDLMSKMPNSEYVTE